MKNLHKINSEIHLTQRELINLWAQRNLYVHVAYKGNVYYVGRHDNVLYPIADNLGYSVANRERWIAAGKPKPDLSKIKIINDFEFYSYKPNRL